MVCVCVRAQEHTKKVIWATGKPPQVKSKSSQEGQTRQLVYTTLTVPRQLSPWAWHHNISAERFVKDDEMDW